jgi:hypothetical protein
MWRSIRDIEHEIVHQILISELCFDICKEIPILPGRGSDFLTFYYNLIFSRGIISLHSLLLSKQQDEMSIGNYLVQHKIAFPKDDITDLEKRVVDLAQSFDDVLPVSLRHKVCAHVDQGFKHTDFTNAYIIPDSVQKFAQIVSEIKTTLFEFVNHSQGDYPFGRIREQSKTIVEKMMMSDTASSGYGIKA